MKGPEKTGAPFPHRSWAMLHRGRRWKRGRRTKFSRATGRKWLVFSKLHSEAISIYKTPSTPQNLETRLRKRKKRQEIELGQIRLPFKQNEVFFVLHLNKRKKIWLKAMSVFYQERSSQPFSRHCRKENFPNPPSKRKLSPRFSVSEKWCVSSNSISRLRWFMRGTLALSCIRQALHGRLYFYLQAVQLCTRKPITLHRFLTFEVNKAFDCTSVHLYIDIFDYSHF